MKPAKSELEKAFDTFVRTKYPDQTPGPDRTNLWNEFVNEVGRDRIEEIARRSRGHVLGNVFHRSS